MLIHMLYGFFNLFLKKVVNFNGCEFTVRYKIYFENKLIKINLDSLFDF